MAATRSAEAELALHVLATTLLVAAIVVGRLRPAWPIWFKLTWRYVIFAALTITVQRLMVSPLHPQYS
jgi:hypothetical protein